MVAGPKTSSTTLGGPRLHSPANAMPGREAEPAGDGARRSSGVQTLPVVGGLDPASAGADNPEGTPMTEMRAPADKAILHVIKLTMVLNVINAVVKLAVGVLSGNLTVISDSVHGFLDAANNVVGLIAIRFSWMPADENHPYGHRKFEALASLAIGGVMTLTCWEILKSIARGVFGEARLEHAHVTPLWLALVLGSLALNLFISRYEARRGRELKSMFLLADAAHTRTDVLVTIFSVSSLLLAPHWPIIDKVLSLVIVGYILRAGWQVVRENAMLLTDAAQLDPAPIRELVESVEGVENCHAIRTHGMPDDIHLDLHIVVAPDLTASQTHEIESAVRGSLRASFPQVREVAIHHQTQLPGGS